MLTEFESLDAEQERFHTLMTELMGRIRRHMHEEESDALPRLLAACDREKLVLLGHRAEQAHWAAPTRTNPTTSDLPWSEVLAPGAGLVDRVRDAVTDRVAG